MKRLMLMTVRHCYTPFIRLMMAPRVPMRLYADRASKFVRQSRVKQVAKQVGSNVFKEYCANSSIHGFRYFVGPNRTIVEKIWWVAMCILSIYGCGSLISNVYDKWRNDPVVVTFAEKPTPIFNIPFPAVTICPLTKVKSGVLNFTDVYQRMDQNDSDGANIPQKTLDRFMAMLQVCEFAFSGFFIKQEYQDNIVHVLEEMAIPFDEIFLVCMWRSMYYNCSELFRPTLTENGICYTFNGLSADDMLRRHEFHQDFEHLGEKRSSANWSMEEGYQPNQGLDTYPRRLVSSGASAGLVVLLKSEVADMDYLCGNSFQGFRMQLHSPNQCPTISSQGIRVAMNYAMTARIEPFLITTSQNVISYDPEQRLCFYTHERHLRFFKIYNKRNCELECLANFTLHMCGCVQFSMPRAAGVRMCGNAKQLCTGEADAILQEQGLDESDDDAQNLLRACNCLPACTYLQYNAEISQSPFDWRRLTNTIHLFENELNNSELTTMSVYYKEAQFISIKRNQLFGINDFIANCGGILGLFMGVSLLSIVEILYYFTMKPLINHFVRRHRKASTKIAVVEPYANGGTYQTAFGKFLRDVD